MSCFASRHTHHPATFTTPSTHPAPTHPATAASVAEVALAAAPRGRAASASSAEAEAGSDGDAAELDDLVAEAERAREASAARLQAILAEVPLVAPPPKRARAGLLGEEPGGEGEGLGPQRFLFGIDRAIPRQSWPTSGPERVFLQSLHKAILSQAVGAQAAGCAEVELPASPRPPPRDEGRLGALEVVADEGRDPRLHEEPLRAALHTMEEDRVKWNNWNWRLSP